MTESLEAPPRGLPAFDLLALDWPADIAQPRTPRHLAARATAMVSAFHAASPSPAAVLGDCGLLVAAARLTGHTVTFQALAFAVGVVAVGGFSHLYADRDTVQTRGIGWYPQPVLPPLVVVAVGSVLARVLSLQDAALLGVSALALLMGGRCLSGISLAFARRRGWGLRATLVIGPDAAADTVCRRLAEFPEAGLRPIRRLDYAAVSHPGAVEQELRRQQVDHVVLVAPSTDHGHVAASLPRQVSGAPYVSIVPALTELFVDPRGIAEVGGIPLIPLGRPTRLRRQFPGKRLFDVVGSGLILLLLLPLFAVVAVAVRLDDGGPVFFRQQRVGRRDRSFEILKFRTMVVGADQMQQTLAGHNVTDGLLFKLRSDPRVTRPGRLLRRTSLDELPQLWNVLRGDMSLVGPRPLAVEPHAFSPQERERHSVRPGITGYWQLSGGNELSYAEMIRLDLAYIRHWSLWLDVRLLLRTLPALVHRHGAV